MYNLALLRYEQQMAQLAAKKTRSITAATQKQGRDPVTGDRLWERADGGQFTVPYNSGEVGS
jgi:hypothetical protein